MIKIVLTYHSVASNLLQSFMKLTADSNFEGLKLHLNHGNLFRLHLELNFRNFLVTDLQAKTIVRNLTKKNFDLKLN